MKRLDNFMEKLGRIMGYSFVRIGYTNWITIIVWGLFIIGVTWLILAH